MKEGFISIDRFGEGLIVLKPDYYLNPGKKIISDIIDSGASYYTLNEIVKDIYQGGIFRRIFIEEGVNSKFYITATDMMKNNPFDSAKNISLKYTPWLQEMTLKENQILVSCAGTVGNSFLVNNTVSGHIGSADIIRLDNLKIPFGFIYAYISCSTINHYIQSMVYGAVIPRISPKELGSLPILSFKKKIIDKIHKKIVKSKELRESAFLLMNEALKYFDHLSINYKYGSHISRNIPVDSINDKYKRLDASNAITTERLKKEFARKNVSSVKISSVADKIFIGPRTKRIYVENGTPFLTTSIMQKSNPTKADRFLSKKNASEYLVKEGWILTTRSGTLGDTVMTLPCMNNFGVSEDAIRIQISNSSKVSNLYVYAFLKSKMGKSALLSGSYGAVVLHLNEEYVGDIDLPILDNDTIGKIENNIKEHINLLNKAIVLENEAITLVEKEIEEWHK